MILRSAVVVVMAVAASSSWMGCGDDDDPAGADAAPTADGAAVVDAGPDPRELVLAPWSHPCDDSLDSVYEVVAPPMSWTPEQRGTVIRCAYDRRVDIAEMRAHMIDNGFEDPGLTTPIHKLRVSYWTERFEGEPVVSTAILYIPEQLRATPSPLVVAGHGSVGIADHCAPSREHPDQFDKDWKALAYTFAADGWLMLMPDFPGLGPPGIAAWSFSPDEGHSILDGTRAVRELGPDVVSSRNALVGHSLGAHAVLSADSYIPDYGTAGSVDTVVVISPFWVSNAAWGALMTSVGDSLITPVFLALTLTYFYGHLAMYEGEDHALDAFLPDKAAAIADMLESGCWIQVTRPETGFATLGITRGADAFKPEYIQDVGNCGLSDVCMTELGQTWRVRWAADRPPPDPSVPIVHLMGGADDFVLPGYQQCGLERLVGQGASVTLCVDAGGEHSPIIARNADWLRQHLAYALLDEPAPDACPGPEVLDGELTCTMPIPNGLQPEQP